jgi:hypothetical protein
MPEIENPYKFVGSLDPQKNEVVCIQRKDEVKRVIRGLKNGEYWAIIGSRQIGKTTFLNLVKKEIIENTHDYCIHLDFELVDKDEREFYQGLIDEFLENIPYRRTKYKTIKGGSPEMSFLKFLTNFKPEDEKKKIVLMFDEIDKLDKLDFLSTFLILWRKVFHEREKMRKRNLYRYAVITAGSVELLNAISGPSSPFNIAQDLRLKDFSEEESEELIQILTELNINLKEDAKKELLSQISGHPQLLQHACHIMVETAKKSNRAKITVDDVYDALNRLINENSSLKTLKKNIQKDEELRNLLKSMLIEKKEMNFFPNSEFALMGAGAIKEENSLCKIRNPIFERCILEILNNPVEETAWKSKEEPKEGEEKEEVKEQNSSKLNHPEAERLLKNKSIKKVFENFIYPTSAIIGVVASLLSLKVPLIYILLFLFVALLSLNIIYLLKQ